jgi:hypothetical protein
MIFDRCPAGMSTISVLIGRRAWRSRRHCSLEGRLVRCCGESSDMGSVGGRMEKTKSSYATV